MNLKTRKEKPTATEKKSSEVAMTLSEILKLAEAVTEQFKNPTGNSVERRETLRPKIADLRLRSIGLLINARSYQEVLRVLVAFDLLDKLYDDYLSIHFFDRR